VRAHRARRLPIKRRAHSRRTVHAHASCVPHYSCYICHCRASFSATSFTARVDARRACACRQGFVGAGRGRLLALPCPSPVSATAHLIRRSAGLRQHQYLLHLRVSGAACLARTVLAASLCCTAARPASASASWPGACLPGRTGTALFGCVKSARACWRWPQVCWVRSTCPTAAAAAAAAARSTGAERCSANLTAACAHSVKTPPIR
jgi:hypothetical protein